MFGVEYPPGGDTEPLTKEQTRRRNIIAVVVVIAVVAPIVGLIATSPYRDIREHIGTVSDVRLISEASVQSDAELKACKFKVNLAGRGQNRGQTLEFFFSWGEWLEKCALLIEGDTLVIDQLGDGRYRVKHAGCGPCGIATIQP